MSTRVIIDCVVLLQAGARPHSVAGRCYNLMKEPAFELCLSAEVIAEYADVFERPEIHRRFPGFNLGVARAFLIDMCGHGTTFDSVPHIFSYPRDPDDEPYIDLASASDAEYLITRDKDLLDLMNERSSAGREFHQKFPGLRILEPQVFIAVMTNRD